jgi:hypothetical protein
MLHPEAWNVLEILSYSPKSNLRQSNFRIKAQPAVPPGSDFLMCGLCPFNKYVRNTQNGIP